MEKPKNIDDFKNIIKKMKHRERYVFNTNGHGDLEVYGTYTSNMKDFNICLTLVDQNGNNKPVNKLLKLWTDSCFLKIYNIII